MCGVDTVSGGASVGLRAQGRVARPSKADTVATTSGPVATRLEREIADAGSQRKRNLAGFPALPGADQDIHHAFGRYCTHLQSMLDANRKKR